MSDMHRYHRELWRPNAMHAVVAARDCKTRQEVLERLQAWGATAEEAQHAIDCAINDGLLAVVREDTSP